MKRAVETPAAPQLKPRPLRTTFCSFRRSGTGLQRRRYQQGNKILTSSANKRDGQCYHLEPVFQVLNRELKRVRDLSEPKKAGRVNEGFAFVGRHKPGDSPFYANSPVLSFFFVDSGDSAMVTDIEQL